MFSGFPAPSNHLVRLRTHPRHDLGFMAVEERSVHIQPSTVEEQAMLGQLLPGSGVFDKVRKFQSRLGWDLREI